MSAYHDYFDRMQAAWAKQLNDAAWKSILAPLVDASPAHPLHAEEEDHCDRRVLASSEEGLPPRLE